MSGRQRKPGGGRRDGSAPRSRTAARARDVDVIVAEVARSMVDGTWARGELATKLQKREGVGLSAVEQWAACAARLLRIGPDVEAYRGINLRRLDEIHASTDDAKARVAAIGEQNKMLGLHAPTTHRVDVTVQPFEQLSDEEQLAKVEEQIATLTELRAKLLEQKSIDVPSLQFGRQHYDEKESVTTNPPLKSERE